MTPTSMPTSMPTSHSTPSKASAEDLALLPKVVTAIHEAGARLLEIFSAAARPGDRAAMFVAGQRNEETVLRVLRAALSAARPGAQ